jgi:hypothetical protein
VVRVAGADADDPTGVDLRAGRAVRRLGVGVQRGRRVALAERERAVGAGVGEPAAGDEQAV